MERERTRETRRGSAHVTSSSTTCPVALPCSLETKADVAAVDPQSQHRGAREERRGAESSLAIGMANEMESDSCRHTFPNGDVYHGAVENDLVSGTQRERRGRERLGVAPFAHRCIHTHAHTYLIPLSRGRVQHR